ncbi:MAG: endolytic transglycosylase MltG, partial [Bacteroidales bacterium]|nr:endolytic transglycosylase MltG [Bacteroidales bacterium]
QKKNLTAHIHPGRYSVFRGMSNDSLVNLLRSGQQTELLLTFKSSRSFESLSQVISRQLECDSTSLSTNLNDLKLIDSLGFSQETWMGMFLPNSYRFYWNTDARGFILRMKREYLTFWNSDREKRLVELGLNKNELMTLASIIQDETARVKDMPKIAGVYMNRLNRGMKLQSCPTVIFAWGEPRLRRLLNKHLKISSPYNTYRHKGLPPGPIRISSMQAIEACINYEHHDFLYFSAKEDFSGGTVFAKSYAQHLRNARKYQKALNKRNIK